MKKIIFILLVIILIIFIGTWPLSIIAEFFKYLGYAFEWLAKGINFFGWNGML